MFVRVTFAVLCIVEDWVVFVFREIILNFCFFTLLDVEDNNNNNIVVLWFYFVIYGLETFLLLRKKIGRILQKVMSLWLRLPSSFHGFLSIWCLKPTVFFFLIFVVTFSLTWQMFRFKSLWYVRFCTLLLICFNEIRSKKTNRGTRKRRKSKILILCR